MALMKIIAAHPDVALSQELPNGKWAHSPEYFKLRYPDKKRTPKVEEDEFTKAWKRRLANMSVEDRAQLLAQLDTAED